MTKAKPAAKDTTEQVNESSSNEHELNTQTIESAPLPADGTRAEDTSTNVEAIYVPVKDANGMVVGWEEQKVNPALVRPQKTVGGLAGKPPFNIHTLDESNPKD